MKIIKIPLQEVPAMYPVVSGLLSKALEYGHGETNLEDIYKRLIAGDMQLWVITDEEYLISSAFITEPRVYPENITLVIPILGGDRVEEWLDMVHDEMVRFAKFIGAKYIEIIGRKGWERKLSKHGFGLSYVCLHKEA